MRIIAAVLLSGTLLLHAASIEVATIKPAVPDAAGSSGEDGRNGVLKMWNVSLKRCIRYGPRNMILLLAIRKCRIQMALSYYNGCVRIDQTPA